MLNAAAPAFVPGKTWAAVPAPHTLLPINNIEPLLPASGLTGFRYDPEVERELKPLLSDMGAARRWPLETRPTVFERHGGAYTYTALSSRAQRIHYRGHWARIDAAVCARAPKSEVTHAVRFTGKTRSERNAQFRAERRARIRAAPECVSVALPGYTDIVGPTTRLPPVFPTGAELYVGKMRGENHVSAFPFRGSRQLNERNYKHYVGLDFYAAVNGFAADKLRVGITHDDLFASFSSLQSEFAELLNSSDATNLLSVLQNGHIGDQLTSVTLPTAADPRARVTMSLEGKDGAEAITEYARYHGGYAHGQKHINLKITSQSLSENVKELNGTIATALSNIFEDNELAKAIAPAITALIGKYGDNNSARGRTVLYERLLRAMFAARAGVPAENAVAADDHHSSRALMPHASVANNANVNWRSSGGNNAETANYNSTLNQRLRHLEVRADIESDTILIPISGFPTLLSARFDIGNAAASGVSDIRRALLALSRIHLPKCGFRPDDHKRGPAAFVEDEPALPGKILLVALDNIVFNAAGVGKSADFVPIDFTHNNFNGVAAEPRTYKLAIGLLLCTIGGADQLTEAFNNIARDAPRFAGPQIGHLSSTMHVRYTHAGARVARAAYHRIVFQHTRSIRNTHTDGAQALGSFNPQWPLIPRLATATTYEGDVATDPTVRNALTDAVFGAGNHRAGNVINKEITPRVSDRHISALGLAFARSANRGNIPAAGADLTDLEIDHYWHCLFLNADISSLDAFQLELAELPLSVSDSLVAWVMNANQQGAQDWEARWGFVQAPGANRDVVAIIQHEGHDVTAEEIQVGYAHNRDFIHTTTGLLVDQSLDSYVGFTALRNAIIAPLASPATDLDRRMAADILATPDEAIFRVNILRSMAMRATTDLVSLRLGITPGLVDLVRSGQIQTDDPSLNSILRAYRIPTLSGKYQELVLQMIQTWDVGLRKFGIKDMTATFVTKRVHTNARIPLVANIVDRYITEADIALHCLHPATVCTFLPGVAHPWKMLARATTLFTKGIEEFPSLYQSLQVDGKTVTRTMLIATGERRLAQVGINQRVNMSMRLEDPDLTAEPISKAINKHYMRASARLSATAERDGNMIVPALCLIRNRALERFVTMSEPYLPEIEDDGALARALRTRSASGTESVSLVPSSFSFPSRYFQDDFNIPTTVSPSDLLDMSTTARADVGWVGAGLRATEATQFPTDEETSTFEFLNRHGYKLIPHYTNAEVMANRTLRRIASRSRLYLNPLKVKDGYNAATTKTQAVPVRVRAAGNNTLADGTMRVPGHSYGFYAAEVPQQNAAPVHDIKIAQFSKWIHSAPALIPRRVDSTKDMATCSFFVFAIAGTVTFSRWVWQAYQSNVHPLLSTGSYKYASVSIDMLKDDVTPLEKRFIPEDDDQFFDASWSDQSATDSDAALKEVQAALEASASAARVREEKSAAALAEAQAMAAKLTTERDQALGELKDLKASKAEDRKDEGGSGHEQQGPPPNKPAGEGTLPLGSHAPLNI